MKVGGGGNATISSNRAIPGALSLHFIPATSAHCVITADFFTTDQTASNAAIVFRSATRANDDDKWQLTSVSGEFRLSKHEGGSETWQDTNSSLGSNNSVIRAIEITLNGGSIKVKVDGNTLWDIFDPTNRTGVYHGIRFTGFGSQSWVDNFNVSSNNHVTHVLTDRSIVEFTRTVVCASEAVIITGTNAVANAARTVICQPEVIILTTNDATIEIGANRDVDCTPEVIALTETTQ